jgi:soluble lytic murein transglycosylase-like protein
MLVRAMGARIALVGVLLLTAALRFQEAAAEGPYRFVDAEGALHITNVPPRLHAREPRSFAGASVAASNQAAAPGPYLAAIEQISAAYDVDATLVQSVIAVESAFDPLAVSRKGARGLMQLMPQTASALGIRDAYHPLENIAGGVRHLRYLLDRYAGDLSLAVAAYNAGEKAVDAYHGIPPYPETQQYVQRVLGHVGLSRTPQPMYRYEDSDGSRVYSNVPPRPRSTSDR